MVDRGQARRAVVYIGVVLVSAALGGRDWGRGMLARSKGVMGQVQWFHNPSFTVT